MYTYSMSQKNFPFPFRSVSLPFSTVPVRSVPFRTVPFTSVPYNRLPRANSFSAGHEFVCKIHCVCWRYIARLFSTIRSEMGPTMRRATGRALLRSSLLGHVRGLGETGALALTCIFYASLLNVLYLWLQTVLSCFRRLENSADASRSIDRSVDHSKFIHERTKTG